MYFPYISYSNLKCKLHRYLADSGQLILEVLDRTIFGVKNILQHRQQ